MSAKLTAVELAPTVTAAAYSSLDQVGEIMTLPRTGMSGAGRVLRSVLLVNTGGSAFGWEMYFYKSLPSLTSSDHSTLAYTSSAEFSKLVAVMTSENQKSGGLDASSSEWAQANFERFPNGLYLGDAETLYAVVRTNTTPTLASTSSVRWVLGIEEVLNAR